MEIEEQSLTRGQSIVLGIGCVLMLGVGAVGAIGTFTNATRSMDSSTTALGVVAAGEGLALILAVTMVGLTMLGQVVPTVVRVGLWCSPISAAVTGVVMADNGKESMVYAVTPMAMSAAAEGVGLLARRIVIYRTGVDAEAQRRNASAVQQLAYHRAMASGHPDKKVQRQSELTAWKLAGKVGVGDVALGAGLITVQRERLTQGADTALASMFGASVTPPALGPGVTSGAAGLVTPPVTPAVTPGVTPGVTPPVTPGVTQDAGPTPPVTPEPVTPVTQPVTPTGVPAVTPPSDEERVVLPVDGAVTLEEIAAVAGVETPVPGMTLTDVQLVVVLRHLRYSVDPPMSYRQAVSAFREAGFVGGEKRVRQAWGALMSHEEESAKGSEA